MSDDVYPVALTNADMDANLVRAAIASPEPVTEPGGDAPGESNGRAVAAEVTDIAPDNGSLASLGALASVGAR